MNKLTFGLLENAFDYMQSAAECVREGDARSLKRAIRDLAAAMELFLKARLHAEHWSLIFQIPGR